MRLHAGVFLVDTKRRMDRKSVIAGNWKMEVSHKGAIELSRALNKLLEKEEGGPEVVVCPSFTSLPAVSEAFSKESGVNIGAQNVHWEERGAFTGEVSVSQLTPFASWCIVGHSERRALAYETEEQVVAKVMLLLKHGITPIVCIGESREEREADQTITKITTQMETLLSKITRVGLTKLVIAYEPIWAISANNPTGEMPDPNDVAGIALLIRKLIATRFDQEAAQRVRVLYGGSVKPNTVEPFMQEPGIDGALVGGASVHPMDFVEIIKKAKGTS